MADNLPRDLRGQGYEKLKVGLQLYSIRDTMKADMDAAFKAVKKMGCDYVEFAGVDPVEYIRRFAGRVRSST